MQQACPLYPQKRTCAVQLGMSALCQKRTHAAQQKRLLIESGLLNIDWRRLYVERAATPSSFSISAF